jgi:hypothetical protein
MDQKKRYVDYIREFDNNHYTVFYHIGERDYFITIPKNIARCCFSSDLDYLLNNNSSNREMAFPLSDIHFKDFSKYKL